ncbi:MAG: hypothetical protein DSY46_02165 [Hydrogenimonas sp.]|nr:MAG: hypothetical protein DSY46_02165 [Hydrogenimonas sp.]
MGRLLSIFLPLIIYAGSPKGETIYITKGCYGCHGTKGEGIGDYPKLAGKPAKALIEKLHRLQRGIGETSKRNLMIPFAKDLSEAEIQAVSHYLSQINQNRSKEPEVADEYLGGFGS